MYYLLQNKESEWKSRLDALDYLTLWLNPDTPLFQSIGSGI